MRDILNGSGIEIATREELGIDIEVEETGATFLENALLKARAICEASGLPAIADDSGLVVDALNGEPGVYSSTYGGDGLDAGKRFEYLLHKMRGIERRSAKFVCTIVCAFPDGSIIKAEGVCRGTITSSPRGSGGFGYDPVFLVHGTDKTMAELTSAEKNRLSHRGQALRRFLASLHERGIA